MRLYAWFLLRQRTNHKKFSINSSRRNLICAKWRLQGGDSVGPEPILSFQSESLIALLRGRLLWCSVRFRGRFCFRGSFSIGNKSRRANFIGCVWRILRPTSGGNVNHDRLQLVVTQKTSDWFRWWWNSTFYWSWIIAACFGRFAGGFLWKQLVSLIEKAYDSSSWAICHNERMFKSKQLSHLYTCSLVIRYTRHLSNQIHTPIKNYPLLISRPVKFIIRKTVAVRENSTCAIELVIHYRMSRAVLTKEHLITPKPEHNSYPFVRSLDHPTPPNRNNHLCNERRNVEKQEIVTVCS